MARDRGHRSRATTDAADRFGLTQERIHGAAFGPPRSRSGASCTLRHTVASRLWPFRSLKTVQQTFVVPSDLRSEAPEEAADRLARWLNRAHAFFAEKGLEPTLHDVLWLPRDVPFLLSATSDTPGFAVSYAFETSNAAKIKKIQAAFSELSDVLWTDYRGRVYLVKNVSARPETLTAMYGDELSEFFTLKEKLDPEGLLRNRFLDKTLGPSATPPSA